MNKKELIEKYEEKLKDESPFNKPVAYAFAIERFLNELKQLDEPQKPVVPPVVSIWYLINKDNLYKNIAYLCANWVKSTTDDTLFDWMSNTDNFIEILVNMHKFGYEVEEEKRYVVKAKGNIKENMLVYGEFVKRYFFTKNSSVFNVRYSHTRKELEDAGFGWVFDCEGIEIEELEDET